MTAINNTITANSAINGGGIFNVFTATLINNIVATNSAPNGNDLFGTYAGTWNLIGNVDGSTGVAGAPNRSGTTGNLLDPMLSPLQNNGGPTFTRLPLQNSPAIDKGNSATVVLDQCGENLPVDNPSIDNEGGNGADIGSVEVQFGPTSANVSVGGRVMRDTGKSRQPLVNTIVTLTSMNGLTRITRTSSFGYFQFEDVEAGETYIVNVKSKQCQFNSQVINIGEKISDLEFIYCF